MPRFKIVICTEVYEYRDHWIEADTLSAAENLAMKRDLESSEPADQTHVEDVFVSETEEYDDDEWQPRDVSTDQRIFEVDLVNRLTRKA